MVMPDALVLESLFQRMESQLATACSKPNERPFVVQQLISKVLAAILINQTDGQNSYDSRLRSLLKMTIKSLMDLGQLSHKPSSLILSMAERDVLESIADMDVELTHAKEEESDDKRLKRWAGVGLATLAGGVIVGVTGGLAAPLIAGGLGTLSASLGVVGASGFVGALGSVGGAAIVGSIFGLTGAGLAGYKLNKQLKDIEEFYFEPLAGGTQQALSYTIAVSGWLTSMDDGPNQWQYLTDMNPLLEVSMLFYEKQALVDLSKAAKEFIATNLISYGVYGAALMTSAAALTLAISFPITLLQAASMLDNPWNMALKKSEQAGQLLARSVLAKYIGGKRPVTLVGNGMGARVIVYCLLELLQLTDDKDVDVYGIIDSVYLMGASVSLSQEQWECIKPLVADRFVNCYSENDWFLKLLFRLHPNPVAGCAPIEVNGVENINVTSMIVSHDQYVEHQDELLSAVGFGRVVPSM
jgi:hypothetical protein